MPKLIRLESGRRAPVVLGVGIVVVVGIGALLGFVVERAANPRLASLHLAVVNINSDLGGGNISAGTGMILTPTGEVLTTNHVIAGAHSIRVQTAGGGAGYAAAVAGIDPSDDIALLQLQDAAGLATVSIGDSSTLAVGNHVTAVGRAQSAADSPAETHGAVTALGQSVITADSRGANVDTLSGMIQFTAQIGAADSGGPLVDSAGQVVGMDAVEAARVRLRTVAADTGFAIPINAAMRIARAIETGAPNPNVLRGQAVVLGVSAEDSVTPPGALVDMVEFVSPAQAAGIATHDVIVSLGGTTVDSAAALRRAILLHQPGDHVRVVWLDPSGQRHSATIQLTTGTV